MFRENILGKKILRGIFSINEHQKSEIKFYASV